MATGNDVREIFQLKPSEQVRRVHKTEKKPDGISRELYGLIGNNVSSVAFNNPTYKPKLNVSKKAVNWTWRPFVNPSRDDDLILHHWEKTRTDPNEEYRFYKFNKVINLIEFTPEEYASHLEDPDWTLEETTYLWDLCRRFDLRWVVIQDRYEWPPQEQDRLALTYYNGNAISKASTTNNDKLIETTDNSTSDSTDQSLTADATTATTTEAPTSTAADTTAASGEAAPALSSTDSTATSTTTTDGTTPATTTTTTTTTTATPSSLPLVAPSGGVVNSTTNPTSTTAPSTSEPTPMEIVSFTPAKIRSMEDLKNRYYSINRTLIKMRMAEAQSSETSQLLSSMAYDKNREMERKKNLEILNSRTPEQIEEEEALYLEARRIDQNEKRITRERESLLRLLNTRDIYGPGGPTSAGLPGQVASGGGPGTGIIIPSNSITIPSSSPSSNNNNNSPNGPLSPSVGKNSNGASAAAAAGNSSSQNATVKKRKKAPKGSTHADDSSTATGSGANSSTSLKGSSNRRLSNTSINESSSSTLPQGTQVKKEKLPAGAYLRSQKMTPIVSTKQQRVSATLTQLGLGLRPAMPTATVMSKWDQLNNNIVTLLDLKKQVDKLESDLKVAKMRRGSVSGVGLFPASGTGSNGGGSSGAVAAGSGGGSGSALSGAGPDGNFGVKREGAVDETGTPGQVKKKKRKEL
ncbi:swr complex subunit [Entomortierella lignicola]|nr:swr complex subunit [Entomortierella lignicola]